MPHAIVVTDATFEREITRHDGLAVADFFAEWCGPCHFVAPAIEQLAAGTTPSRRVLPGCHGG